MKTIYFAGGCFWGTQHFFKQLNGVERTQVGFANGLTENPTYEEVYTDTTGFAEAVEVTYDENKINLEFLLEMFFHAIDPTALNRQGYDEGTRYRTGVYYTEPQEKHIIDKFFEQKRKEYKEPIVTEVEELKNFYSASESHQNYLDKNPQGYCHLPLELFAWARKQNRG